MKNWCFVVTGLILLDQVTKMIMTVFFRPLVRLNWGISFGLFPAPFWLFINLGILLVLFLFLKESFIKALLIGGGMSNLVDRILRGGVVDFINLNSLIFWKNSKISLPIFNFADFFICLGFLLITIKKLRF